jgi:hypothetical protein
VLKLDIDARNVEVPPRHLPQNREQSEEKENSE